MTNAPTTNHAPRVNGTDGSVSHPVGGGQTAPTSVAVGATPGGGKTAVTGVATEPQTLEQVIRANPHSAQAAADALAASGQPNCPVHLIEQVRRANPQWAQAATNPQSASGQPHCPE